MPLFDRSIGLGLGTLEGGKSGEQPDFYEVM
jgi:hypothetical protein